MFSYWRIDKIVHPTYPAGAAKRSTAGRVVLDFVITAQGRAEEVSVVDSDPPRVFDAAAREAIRQWRFVPTSDNPARAPVRVRLEIKFHVKQDAKTYSPPNPLLELTALRLGQPGRSRPILPG